MKIRTWMYLSLVVFGILVTAILLLSVSSSAHYQQLQARHAHLDQIQTESFQLYLLENDLVMYGEDRPAAQWKTVYGHLSDHIDALDISDPEQQAALQQLKTSRQEISAAFAAYMALRDQAPGSTPAPAELSELTITTLSGRTQALISGSMELAQLVDAEMLSVQRENLLIVFGSLALLVMFVCLNLLFFSRTILGSLDKLRAGTDRISAGCLEHPVEIQGRNELGELADAFNAMAERIRVGMLFLEKANEALKTEVEEKRASQAALRESEERFRIIATSTPDHIVEQDRDLRYLLVVNPQLGLTEEIMIGRTDAEILNRPDAEKLTEIKQAVLSTGQPRDIETFFVARDGSLQFFEGRYIPRRDSHGSVSGVIGYLRNITDRRAAEQALVLARKKLAMLNTITFQDIQSALFALSTYCSLSRRSPPGVDVREYLENEVALIKTIADSLAFARDYKDLGISPPRWQDAGLTFRYAVSHLNFEAIACDIQPGPLEIYADPLLEKAFFHILQNTLLHGKGADRIRIGYQAAGPELVLVIEDNGIGIPGDLKEEIFQRRQNSGLFLVREILSITGMTISETGTYGSGARFEIRVPSGSWRTGGT